MGTPGNVLIGNGTLSIKAPYSESTWASVGYTEAGVNIAHTPEYMTGPIPSFFPWPVDSILLTNTYLIGLRLMEATIANLKVAMPGYNTTSSTSSKIVMGNSDASHQLIGFKVVGTGPEGATRTLTIPYGRVEGPTAIVFSKVGGQFPNLAVRCFGDGTNDPFTLEDA